MADPTSSERAFYRTMFQRYLAHRWSILERNVLRLESYHRPRRNFAALRDASDRVALALTRGAFDAEQAFNLAVSAGVAQRTELGKVLRTVWLNQLREDAQRRFYG